MLITILQEQEPYCPIEHTKIWQGKPSHQQLVDYLSTIGEGEGVAASWRKYKPSACEAAATRLLRTDNWNDWDIWTETIELGEG